ncbi:Cytochrome c-552 [Sterolibacterium denitrificans]|uniref:Cytochrome c-552 n=1 Tax=Sterolibacterium denitrificans TaxID=157592 RepID=A0A7Z7HPX2_9PROT|nr:c-type cytochrome [Sterolibacterium denitrificans]SMB22854.1 Cytochrome c-552 [Sterolibacterium denitrificans]
MNMRLTAAATALGWAFAAATPALAGDSSSIEKLATDKMCFHCHEIKGEKRGPAFEDIARRYAGQADARPRLVKAVQAGTTGPGVMRHWGNLKMPRDADRVPVSEAEAEQLVDYILGLKK